MWPDDCPHRFPERGADSGEDGGALPGAVVLPAPEEAGRFTSSGALGLDEVRALMRKEYCQVIGLLGEPDSGKTACLVSLYLLLCREQPRWIHLR